MHFFKAHKVFSIIFVCAIIATLLTSAWALFHEPKSTPNPSVGAIRLNISTYLAGQNQPTHPSVCIFPQSFNNYKYYLAYSPYPYSNGEEENPCLAVSNDLYHWESPVGLANPIADNEETGCNELKDPHIVFRDDLNRLEMWYLGRLSVSLGGDGTSLLLFRKVSTDGVQWSDYEVMTEMHHLSPAIIWDGEKYKMWSIGFAGKNTEGVFVYQESADGYSWSEPVLCSIGNRSENINIWHGSVEFFGGKYHLVYVDNTNRQEIFYSTSDDGISFSDPQIIVQNNAHWKSLYRPTIAFDEDSVICMYGVIDYENRWYISMSTGESVSLLKGISAEDESRMITMTDDPNASQSTKDCIKDIYNAATENLRMEIFGVVIVELAIIAIFKQVRKSKWFYNACIITNALVIAGYLLWRAMPVDACAAAAVVIAWLFLYVCTSAVLFCAEYEARFDKTSQSHPSE